MKMFRTSFDLKELKGYERDLVIIDVIRDNFVDATNIGKPRFRIKTLVKMIRDKGYNTTGTAIYRFFYSAKVEGVKVFEKSGSRGAKYVCDPTIFKQFYDETKVSYMLPLFINNTFR